MPQQGALAGMLPYLMTMVLFAVGLYAITCKKNLIKIIVGIIIMEYAVNLFLILTGYRAGGEAPILVKGADQAAFLSSSVDPVPQALILTSIVIGLGVVALMVALAVRIYERYGTFDVSEIRRLKG